MSNTQKRRIRHQSQCSLTGEPSQKQKIMKCPNKDCDKVLSSYDKFCPECGTQITSKDSVICSKCNQIQGPEDKFCGGCGTKVTKSETNTKPRVCSGKLGNGSPCGYNLLSSLTFCPNCGTPAPAEPDKPEDVAAKGVSIVQKDVNPDAKSPEKDEDGQERKKLHQGESSDKNDEFSGERDGRPSHASRQDFGNDPSAAGEQSSSDTAAENISSRGQQLDVPSQGGSGSQHREQVFAQISSPVPCTEDTDQVKGSTSMGTPTHKLSETATASEKTATTSEKTATASDSSQSSHTHDRNAGGKSVTGAETGFSQFAGCSFYVDKKVISMEIEMSNKDTSAADDQADRTELDDKDNQASLNKSDDHREMGPEENDEKHGTGTASDLPLTGSDQTRQENTPGHQLSASENLQDKSDEREMDVDKREKTGDDKDLNREHPLESAQMDDSAKPETDEEGEKKDTEDKKEEDDSGTSRNKKKKRKKQKSEKNAANEKENDQSTSKQHPDDKDNVPSSSGPSEGTSGNQTSQIHVTVKSYADVAGGVRTRSSQANTASSLMNKADKVTVIFHVIVSELWEDFDPQKYDIFLRCGPQILGGFEPPKDKNKMKCMGQTDIGFLYEGKLEMEKHLRNSDFDYKYIARKLGKNGEYTTGVEWEQVQEKKYSQRIVNRRFFIPVKQRACTGVWHRYDGVAYFPKALSEEGLFHRLAGRVKKWIGLTNFGDRKLYDAVASAQVFLPSAEEIYNSSRSTVSDGKMTLEGYLAKIHQVMSTLRFQMKGNNFTVDESLVSKAIHDAVVLPVTEKISKSDRKVTLALFLLFLMDEFTMKPKTDVIQYLCCCMLISPEKNNMACADLECITSHFPTRMANKGVLASRISYLLKESSGGYSWQYVLDYSWLYCVPLLHFLQERSQPFQKPEPSSYFGRDEWWGVTTFVQTKDAFKAATRVTRIPDIVMEQIAPAFQVDPLFVRTLVASLDLEPLLPVLLTGVVPIEVMAATLSHHLQEKSYIGEYHKMKMQQCMIKMISDLKKISQKHDADQTLKEAMCNAQIIQSLHQQLIFCRDNATEETRIAGTQLAYLAVDCVALVEQRLHQQNGTELEHTWWILVKDVTERTCSWLSNGFKFDRTRPHTLQKWDALLAKVEEDLSHGDVKERVKKHLAEGFENELRKLSAGQKLEVYLEQTNVAPAFADILNRLAFDALDEAFKMESRHLGEKNRSIRLVSLLSSFIEQKWREQVKKEEDILEFVITWIPMVNYFRRFAGEDKECSTLSSLAAKNIRCALDCLEQVLAELSEGSILIRTLQLLTSAVNRERFLTIVAAVGHDRKPVSDLLELRDHELQTYISTGKCLDTLLGNCKQLFSGTDLPEVLNKSEEIRDKAHTLPLSEVCPVALPDSIKDLRAYTPKANPWKLPEDILAILPVFEKWISSYIFNKLFTELAKEPGLSSVFWRAVQLVWSNVSKEWQSLRQKMTEGTITLAETEKVFSMFRSQEGSYRYADIRKELEQLSTHDDTGQWVDERIQQFQCFTTIKNHVKAASVLLRARETVGVAGDFGDIEKICSLSQDKNLEVRKVDRSVLHLCSQLEDVKEQDIMCLEEFLDPRCQEFVGWLKDKMKDGVKELNVFVDLAFISAGEEPWAIARVDCFHAATIGYAPLIFMEKGEGCRHLLKQCGLVFANVIADPSLPKKLKDSSRFLDWFKDVENSLGSVEKTCLSQVGNINERGVFRIGRGEKTRMTLPSVIQLKVSEEKDPKNIQSEDRQSATPARKYTYEELLDLQSRLMLVAGEAEKRKENVDRFITIMESMIRLGKTYMQLCRDGCVLFLDWTVEFLCDMKRPVCCISEFSSQGKLKGHRGAPSQVPGRREDLEDFIAGVAGFLEQCHSQWLSYVDLKRKEYPELNVFTVEQLVFLQQQLVRVGSEDHNISKHVYPMLSLLKADCSPQDLEQALQDAMDHIDSLQQQQQQQRSSSAARQQQTAQQPVTSATDKEKVAAFMSEMRAMFSKGLALKALQQVGADDIAAGIAWCMKHEDDVSDDSEEEMEEEELEGEEGSIAMEEEAGSKRVGQRLKEWVTRTETITQCAIGWLNNMDKRDRGTTLRSLTGNLRSVWTKFLDTVSSSGLDFLSLEHLGIILKCLAAEDERVFKRVLPPNFKAKIPNLILCPRNEVLNAVTYMYMFPEEEGTPLPQPDEVLLCTEHTTFEQVDIFLRRAFFGHQEKVHCLAFADNLDYDVGEKTEKKISEYTTLAGDHEFRLVVVCTTENEYRARIVAALEKFRQPSPALSKPAVVRKYLRSRFAGVISKSGITSASAVDPESLSVRVVKSNRSGVGKTLYKQRQMARLQRHLPRERRPVSITIPLHGRTAHSEEIAACLLQHTLDPSTALPRIVHLDISYQVLEGVDHLLYSLLVLGCVCDSQGQVWLRSPMDLYLVETMPLLDHKEQRGQVLVHQIFEVLPSLNCWSPQDSLNIMRNPTSATEYKQNDCLFDKEEFASEMYQRPFRYLQELDTQRQPQPPAAGPQGDAAAAGQMDCLALLLKYCGVVNPSWSEMTHFVHFLNKQLADFEHSVYCAAAHSQDLPGFSRFVLRFLIQMSRDFATRSLKMSEESLAALMPDEIENTDINQYEMRRTWESSPHPYIFFNSDGDSMTFLGFYIDRATGNLVDQQTGRVLEQGIMERQLYDILIRYNVPLSENFDILPREDRLLRLYRALGLRDSEMFDENDEIIDPDDTYELTTDNVKKILAIYMRFRCNIPVIVMGETGCGKTRLVRFLCSLQIPKNQHINTMVQVKVHGGTTGEDIIKKVRQAEVLAQLNDSTIKHRPIYTVLFFDEANTTEAVGVIKEVMCDGTLDGQQMNLCPSLKMVAACNPYRKHSEELIERLENAGLGYHVDADKTVDKLGRVPMRRLVYRVQPLPQSMLPLVWDFGQLNTRVEELYIRQMVRRYVRNRELAELDDAGMNVLCKILMKSQEFMRKLADECSFVSLRDVDRSLTVASWFLKQARDSGFLFRELDKKLNSQEGEDREESESESAESPDMEEEEEELEMSAMTRALVLSLGVCYRACLRSKEEYDQHIIPHFEPPFSLPQDMGRFAVVIDRCQDVFLDSVRLADNIARNQALKENVFMMVVCVELRIPLFLVGKPGSSKSLAKTIVADAMQGNAAYSELFKTFKQAQMVSFQCSPLATADGILGTFRQCAKFQEGKSKTSFVSVVVLDEVGLAEDSPRMPLKTLHPLLEDGCPGDEIPDDSKKVAFIGISNWALDPAKMNRGILVQRDIPDEQELIETARGICTTQDQLALKNVNELIPDLAKAYLNIFQEAKEKREFFGLRDFYSLVKMVYTFAAQSKQRPSQRQLIASIRRNFGGLDTIDPVKSFRKLLPASLCEERAREDDPDCNPSGLIKAALSGDDMGGETRYLLLLTENYGGLSILSENLLADRRVVPIFGSSFPKDQEYTQICRNINRIKVCMETGQTVILLNLENLYESLYDALNQYYAMLGSDRFVDLGLGTHRVKCKVHRQFRLIVVAEKQAVYDKFPIPLINRLEKHFLTLNNIMTDEQLALATELEKWARQFVTVRTMAHMRMRARDRKAEEVGDVFMGYHPDTAPAIVLKVWNSLGVSGNPSAKQQVLEESQRMLLWCATPDAVVRSHDNHWSQVYHDQQQHEHLLQYLEQRLQHHLDQGTMLMAQVTTHSKLLTEQERVTLRETLPVCTVTLLSLQAFDTEQQFCQQLRLFFSDSQEGHKLLLVQCDSGDSNQNLIKGAQYCMQDLRPPGSCQHHVAFIIQLPSIAGACFTGFLGGNWHCLHIDELRATDRPVPSITLLQSQTLGDLLMAAIPTETERQTEDFSRDGDLMQWEAGEAAHAEVDEGVQAPMEVDVADVQLDLGGFGLSPEDGEAPPQAQTPPQRSPQTPTQPPLAVEASHHQQQPQGFSPQFVRELLRLSIQAAVALVRDPEGGTLRATRRITILLYLLEDNADFFKGLLKLVASVMKEKEKRGYEAEHWLSKEAAKLETVKKAGTFRRSWMQYMENKTVPVLAGVIAYLDTNHNLDLHPALESAKQRPGSSPNAAATPTPPSIQSEAGGSSQALPATEWVGDLWLAVLQQVCQLRYRQLRSVSGKEELEEFTVRHTGAGGSLPFSARLPFSWLLWEFVEKAIAGAKSVQGDLLDAAGGVVDQSPLGQCVRQVLGGSEDRLRHLFHLYIADLLHFTFPLTPHLHQLLCECVEKGLGQLHIDLVQLEVGRGVVALHMLLQQMRPRLQAILDMAAAREDAVAALQAGSGACRELLGAADEMTEDVALLRLLVEEIQPRLSQLDEERGCQEWLTHYSAVAPIILRILSDSDSALSHHAHTAGGEEEEEEEVSAVNSLPYGDKCQQQLVAVRSLWTRVATLKLFLDFVGPLRQGPQKLAIALEKVKLQLLCKLLGDSVDMKRAESLRQVDAFLKHANSKMFGYLLGKLGNCTYCEKKFESSPVELPCSHRLCNSCYRDSCHGNTEDARCPECRVPVPPDFDPVTAENRDREAGELLGRYQRQISGFLMALVSQLCFTGRNPPEPAAVEHIFGYIIHVSKGRTLLQTKNMTVHDDLIDPTPVLRSFLLRLLLKHSEREVYDHLEQFLEKAQKMVEQEQVASPEGSAYPTLLEFCLLIIHCVEDLQHEQDAVLSRDVEEEHRLLYLGNMLRELSVSLRTPSPVLLPSLYTLGRLRYALDACAHVLYCAFVAHNAGAEGGEVGDGLHNLLLELRDVCENRHLDWPKKFLVKQLCREYGIQDFMTLIKRAKQDHRLAWIAIQESVDNPVEVVADRYLVCGDHYKTMRELLAQLKLDGDSADLLQMLQGVQLGGEQKETLLLLALHREVTMSVLYPTPDQVRTLMDDNVKQLIQVCPALQDKNLANQLCANRLSEGDSALCTQAGQDLGDQSLMCVLTHLHLALRPGAMPTAANVLTPLTTLLFHPANMVNAFLPTMPQDNIGEVLAVIKEKVWQCPRGHRYLIGNCGQPATEGVCPCGSRIGGVSHKPNAANVENSGVDTTQTGHILGPAAQRGLESVPERQLNSVECGVLRFLLHSVLYLSASTAAQAAALCQMVTPRIAPQQTAQYFLAQVNHDLRVLQRCVGRSADDVYLLLHHVCYRLASTPAAGPQLYLRTKEERTRWEQVFTPVFIAPVLQNMDAIVREGNQAIVSDTRQGNTALLKVVYEDEDCAPGGAPHVHQLPLNPAVWRFRPRITVDHFFRQFHLEVETRQDRKDAFPVLKLFKAQCHMVQALHYVPAILRGQRRLMMQLHRRLDRAEANTTTVGEVMGRNEHIWLEQLMNNFSNAWEIVKEHLIGFQCVAPIEGVMVRLPEELHNATITRDSPVAVLLPSMQGPGLCSYIFLQFILGHNNNFLDNYAAICRHRPPEVPVGMVTERHLVGCSVERDLLPMVLSHSNYSLMVGRAATLDYDFEAFQQQLQDTLLQCKARVQRSDLGHFPVETMVYRADTTSSRLFKTVREKIQQECLSPAERRQIVEDLRDLPEICQSIDNLNTALSFLKALGGDPSLLLHDFMTKALKMTRTVYSRKAQQLCQLTHVQSLWLVLCHQRACILAQHQQDAFDSVEKELREDMSVEQGKEVERMCQQMSVERLELLLLQLFECIMLLLSEPHTQEEDARPENYKLRDVLMTNLESPSYHTEPVEVRSGLLTPNDLLSFPETLQGRHATAAWMLCRAQLAHKRHMLL